MAGSPWTTTQDEELRRLTGEGRSDAAIRLALLFMRPMLTLEGVAQRRRLLGLKRARGGKNHTKRPQGAQRYCLGCDKPFRSRHKHNRLCPVCTDKAKEIAA